MCSIKPCAGPVKRKSQNLANFFQTRPYLVVSFRDGAFEIATRRVHFIPDNTLSSFMTAY
jgi:hypothetical protein